MKDRFYNKVFSSFKRMFVKKTQPLKRHRLTLTGLPCHTTEFTGPDTAVRLVTIAASPSKEDFHLPVTSRSAFAFRLPAPVMALRAMPGAPKKTGVRRTSGRRSV